jgi:hypothetical protein
VLFVGGAIFVSAHNAPGAAVYLIGLGLVLGGAIIGTVRMYARRAYLECSAQTLTRVDVWGRSSIVARRGEGQVVFFPRINGGPNFADAWMVWFDAAGQPIWTTVGRRWPMEQVELARESLGIPKEVIAGAVSSSAASRRYPGAVPFFEAHTACAMLPLSLLLILVVGGIGSALGL